MRKLTDKLKYAVAGDAGCEYAVVYAVRKATGQWEACFTCHLATLDVIRSEGFTRAAARGLLCTL